MSMIPGWEQLQGSAASTSGIVKKFDSDVRVVPETKRPDGTYAALSLTPNPRSYHGRHAGSGKSARFDQDTLQPKTLKSSNRLA
jgi:hypothetical protein